ncbi:MAG: hypothetical protein WDZ28_04295 [Simkaniaceae bacterium]
MITFEQDPYTRKSPCLGKILKRTCLNKEGSSKKTYHIEIEINDPLLSFTPGDAVGIIPENEASEVGEILTLLNATGRENVLYRDEEYELETLLQKEINLSRSPGDRTLPLIDFLRKNPFPSIDTLIKKLSPLLPRFYSIASSPKVYPNHIHLLVGTFTREVNGCQIPGLGSHYLSVASPLNETTIRLFIQRNKRFSLPESPQTPIIMIGPGTGLAPYRAFIQERANARNWLFFGERSRATDFYYEEEWNAHPNLKISTAFSRDQENKIYVQDRLKEESKELISWIEKGAIIYVCGDAKKMAKAVRATLDEVLSQISLSTKQLIKDQRLLLDVY